MAIPRPVSRVPWRRGCVCHHNHDNGIPVIIVVTGVCVAVGLGVLPLAAGSSSDTVSTQA